MPLYAQAEKVLEDLLVRRRYRIGDRIPPEVELVQSLGVSRATIRAAVGRLVGRGLLVRRQGSGTFLARLPERSEQPSPVGIKLGSGVAQLGRLDTYTSIAERLGLKADSDHLRVETARIAPDEAQALELPADGEVTRVCRVLLLDGEPAAWMIDVLPADLIPAAKVRQLLSPSQMMLDLLLDEGIPVAFSEVEISTALLDPGQPARIPRAEPAGRRAPADRDHVPRQRRFRRGPPGAMEPQLLPPRQTQPPPGPRHARHPRSGHSPPAVHGNLLH